MTKEEAKRWIEYLIKTMKEETSGSYPDPPYKDEVYEALRMAVEALDQESKTGKIALDDFIKYAKEQFGCEISVKKSDKPDTFASIFGTSFLSPQELLKMAGENRPIDRSEIGIDTPKTSDGLQSFNDGFDFLQHKQNIED